MLEPDGFLFYIDIVVRLIISILVQEGNLVASFTSGSALCSAAVNKILFLKDISRNFRLIFQ